MNKLVVIYLAAPREWGHMKWSRLDCLAASLTMLKKYGPPLPVIVFHEDYTAEDKARLLSILSGIVFERVDFSTHHSVYVNVRPNERVGTYGYGMMCRFFSGVVQAHPLVQGYTHYLRLDDDSYIVAPVTEATMSRMLASDYTYNSVFSDPCNDLFKFTQDFMEGEHLPVPTKHNENAPFTNFHAASLALWRHPVVSRYVAAIERENGCLCHRWDDAQIQGMIVNHICPVVGLKVHLEPEFAYRHNQQCVHQGQHTRHCTDGVNVKHPWGPPEITD